jgi:hypothetical protein
MVTREQIMSEAKREHSQYLQPRPVGRAPSRAASAAPELLLAPDWSQLRVLEPWEHRKTPSGDPYNGIGARAVSGRALHK